MIKSTPEFHFHKPPILKRVAERLNLCEVTPADIVHQNELDKLFATYRDLAGDPDIGFGNDGNCQSWRGHRQWWKEFFI